MKNKIPTAEEFLKINEEMLPRSWGDDTASGFEYYDPETTHQAMIAFAKLHVKAALEEAAEKAKIEYEYWDSGKYWDEYIDKDTITNAYPESNIK